MGNFLLDNCGNVDIKVRAECICMRHLVYFNSLLTYAAHMIPTKAVKKYRSRSHADSVMIIMSKYLVFQCNDLK